MAGVNVTIGADSSKAQKELTSFQSKTKKIASTIAKGFQERIGHRIFDGFAAAASQLPGLAKHAINQASALNEEIGKSKAVFGKSAEGIHEWSKTTADALGISKVQALEATGTMGNMLHAFGIASDEAAGMSRKLVELAADMGSFNNASIEDSIFAIGAALRGESEPIRKFGVNLNDATLKAEALRMGLYKGTGPLDSQAKAMASYSTILRQTSIQQGNFSETADDIANSNKILQAKLSDLTVTIGESLLPATQTFIDLLKRTDFEAIGNSIGGVAKKAVEIFDVFATNGDSIKLAFEPLKPEDFAGKDLTKEQKELFSEDFKKKIREEEVRQSNASFRENLKQEEILAKKRKEAKLDEEKRQSVIKGIRQEYSKTLQILDARIKGDKKLLEQEEMRKRIQEEQKASASEGFVLSKKSAEKIVMKKKEAEEAEKRRQENETNMAKSTDEKKTKIESDISETESRFGSAMTRSSITAVSSMQAIGGGGGVAGELNLQKTQTDLQRQLVDLQQKMVGLLEGVKTATGQQPVSQ